MFISELTLKNFKRFENASFDTSAAITYLLGPNSSGKSSIIKALLGLKQTLAPTSESEGFATQGEYVDLGTYQDLIFQHDPKKHFTLGITLSGVQQTEGPMRLGRSFAAPTQVSYSFTFDYNTNTEQPRVYSIQILARFGASTEKTLQLSLTRKITRNTYNLSVNREFLDANADSFSSPYFARFRYWIKGLDAAHINRLQFGRGRSRSVEYFPDQSFTWLDYLLGLVVKEVTEKLFYLGPIRSSPLRNYLRTSHSRAVGPHGEYTASVLANLVKRSAKVTTGTSSLQSQLSLLRRMLTILFPGQDFTPKTFQELVRLEFFDTALSSAVKKPRAESITDVGFGFSQIFPILVQLAVMPSDSLLVVEQPELHLHPLAQTRLAAVFALAVASGKRIMAETHSDHLIRGTQAAVASHARDDRVGIAGDKIMTLYTQPSGTPIKLIIGDDGSFDKPWPEGFMDVGYTTLMGMLKQS